MLTSQRRGNTAEVKKKKDKSESRKNKIVKRSKPDRDDKDKENQDAPENAKEVINLQDV